MESSRKRKRWLITGLLLLALLGAVWFSPGPISGCYTLSDFATQGHTFIYFKDGKSWWLTEFQQGVHPFGPYHYQNGLGWVWTYPKTGRRVLVKPYLLYARFESLDDEMPLTKLPFEWRDLNIFKTRKILNDRSSLLK